MTALDKDRKTDNASDPSLLNYPVAASTTLYAGGMGAVNASGDCVPASASNALRVIGRIEHKSDNSSGSAGDKRVNLRKGVFPYSSGTGANAITKAHAQKLCYASDDNTVNLTSNGGVWPAAGRIEGVDSVTSQVLVRLGEPSLFDTNPEVQTTTDDFKARGVVYNNQSDLTAFTVASDDGITYAAGDVVLLVGQTTAAQNGPYVVGTVASTTAPLTRCDWWATGQPVRNGSVIEIGNEGTYYKRSSWKATCTGAKVIGTDDPLLYPRVWRQKVTLASGTYTIGVSSTATPDEPLFLLSTTESPIVATRDTAGGTITTTIMYVAPVASRIAGKAGTAAVEIRSAVAAGTILNTDNSTVDVLITNW